MSFRSRFLLLSRRVFPIPVKTANIHSIQSKSTLKKPWRDWEWNFYIVGIPTGLRVRMWNKVRCDMRTWNVSWITSMFERGRERLVGAEREWYSNDSKISTAFEESEKNQSNILIEDICSIEESDIISPMINVCQCLTFRNNHRGANPSNVQINYVWALPEDNVGLQKMIKYLPNIEGFPCARS